MNNTTLNRFNEWVGILLYVANATSEVSATELMDQVTEYERSRLNAILRMMVEGGYIIRSKYDKGNFYIATKKTKQIFGVAA